LAGRLRQREVPLRQSAFDQLAGTIGRTGERGDMSIAVDVAGSLEREGIVVRAERRDLLAEEASIAYKDIEAVVRSAVDAGHIVPVARLRPLAVIKD
jgi:RNA-splicing ligase RtcB